MAEGFTAEETAAAVAEMAFRPAVSQADLCRRIGGCDFHRKGGSLLSQYKRGASTPAHRAANAAYMREWRERKANGAA